MGRAPPTRLAGCGWVRPGRQPAPVGRRGGAIQNQGPNPRPRRPCTPNPPQSRYPRSSYCSVARATEEGTAEHPMASPRGWSRASSDGTRSARATNGGPASPNSTLSVEPGSAARPRLGSARPAQGVGRRRDLRWRCRGRRHARRVGHTPDAAEPPFRDRGAPWTMGGIRGVLTNAPASGPVPSARAASVDRPQVCPS